MAPIRSAALALVLSLSPLAPAPLAAQEKGRPLDRWLVAEARDGLDRTVSGLSSGDTPAAPERGEPVAGGEWRLVREDGAATLELGTGGGSDALAHVYVKSGSDGPVVLDVSSPSCAAARVWLNGQALPGGDGPLTVRLAGGWNTVLVGLPAVCGGALSAALRTARIPLPEDSRALDPDRLRIQASRPPGFRPGVPAGWVAVDAPRPARLVWREGEDDLSARMVWTVTAWGGGGAPPASAVPREHEAPPGTDLSGEWSLTLYMPMGIQQARAELRMESDGRLEGRLRGERIEDELRDGWVSGDRFGWTARWSGPGRTVDLTFEGTIDGDELDGTIDFGGFGDFEARFDGRRVGAEEPDAGEEPAPELPEGRRPPGGRAGRPARGGPGFGSQPDTETLHQQIIRQLLPPRPPREPAPSTVSVEMRVRGEKLVASAGGLRPGVPDTLTGTVPFRKAREAALDNEGVEARVTWGGDTHLLKGRGSAGAALEAFHAPIALADADSTDGITGRFRVPDILDGFTLRVVEGEWTVDGAPVRGGILCSPCKGGQRYQIATPGAASVQVADPGYPTARRAGATQPAEVWLRTLSNDRKVYREMGQAAGGS